MSRVRIAFVVAFAASFVVAGVQIGCTLSDEYSDGYGQDSSLPGDDGGLDATVPPTSDASAPVDSSADAAVDDAMDPDAAPPVFGPCPDGSPGPWGDYCCGLPSIVYPIDGSAFSGDSVLVQISAPSCIKAMILYVDKDGSAIAGYQYDASVLVPDSGWNVLNVNAWDDTNDAHASSHIWVYRNP